MTEGERGECYQDAHDHKCFVRHGMIDSIPSGRLLHSRQAQLVQTVPGADFSLNINRNREIFLQAQLSLN